MTSAGDETFKRNIAISVGAHVAVAVIVFLRAVLVPSEPIEIRRAIRVDIVGLPQKITEPVKLPEPSPAKPEPIAATPPKAEPAKPEPAKPEPPKSKAPTVNLDKKKPDTKQSQKEALARIKAMQALDKIKNDVNEEKTKPKAGTQVAGNQVSAGNSLTGLDKIEYDRYFDDLEGKIRANWSIPQWLADSPLKAQVQILIDSRGFVTKKIMRRSSGNEIFDAKVLEAIDASSPFPTPPSRLAGALSTGGITLNFPE